MCTASGCRKIQQLVECRITNITKIRLVKKQKRLKQSLWCQNMLSMIHIVSICIGTDNIMLSSEWRYTVTKTFGGLVIFCAIAGNITSYSREIFAQLNSLLYYGLFPAIAKICPSFVFPAVAGIFPRFNPEIVAVFNCVQQESSLAVKNGSLCKCIMYCSG